MRSENPHTIFLIYEPGQVEELERFLSDWPEGKADLLVIALTPYVEAALAEKSIVFSSGREYRPLDIGRFVIAEEWVAWMFDSPQWKWFQYRDISLSRMFSLPAQFYLTELLYYGAIIENLFLRHPSIRRLVVARSLQKIHPKGRALERERINAVAACARLIGTERGIEVTAPQALHTQVKRTQTSVLSSALKRALLEAEVRIFNMSIALVRSRGTPRILVSDYWRNIAPFISRLPQGELMFFDRSEAFKAGIGNIWRYGVRLFNFGSFSVRHRKAGRAETQRFFEEQWSDLRRNGLLDCSVGKTSLRPLLALMLDEILLREVPQALCDIDSAYEMMKTSAPDIVFLRVSMSMQTHFYILAQVARACGIPSLELQHGLEYLGPGSISKQHGAEYVAVYGLAEQDEFVALGFSREKFPIVGSPRFDAYARETALAYRKLRERDGVSVLCIGFAVGFEWFYDDYDLEDYYCAVARALENVPNSSVVVKLRPGSFRERECRSTIDRIFARVPHTIAQYEPLPELFTKADIVISYYSTVVLESLQCSKPTIVFSAQAMEKECIRLHLKRYADAGGLIIADTKKELEEKYRSLAGDSALRSRFARNANAALAQFQSFDGKSSERIVWLIERLTRKQK